MVLARHERHIYGPPGTGKTYTIKQEIEALLEGDFAALPEEIIVSSFTVAAAKELGSRIEQIPDDNISTLHAFGYQQLGGPEVLGGKKMAKGKPDYTDEWNKEMARYGYSISRTDGGLDPDTFGVYDSAGDTLLNQSNVYRSRMVPVEQWDINTRSFYEKWRQFKNMHEIIDFTDMIELPYLRDYPAPFGARIGFFDEAQDFTPLMLARIRQMKQHMDLVVLAGDDDQAIYGFTGVDPAKFIDEPNVEKRSLGQSYRLPSAVLDYSQAWISKLAHRQAKPFAPRADGKQGAVERRAYTCEQPDSLVDEVEALSETGHTVMILCPNNYQTYPIVSALRSHGIPYHNPYRLKEGAWNPLGGSKRDGVVTTADRMLAFVEPIEQDVAHTAGQLRRWMELVYTRGVFRNATAAREQLSKLPYSMPIEPLDYFEAGVYEHVRHGGLQWLSEHLKPEKQSMGQYVQNVITTRTTAALKEPPRVIIGTIHSVKGGEAEHVFLLPSLSKDQYGEYQKAPDAFIRQFYVGMTRAREALYLCDYKGQGIDL